MVRMSLSFWLMRTIQRSFSSEKIWRRNPSAKHAKCSMHHCLSNKRRREVFCCILIIHDLRLNRTNAVLLCGSSCWLRILSAGIKRSVSRLGTICVQFLDHRVGQRNVDAKYLRKFSQQVLGMSHLSCWKMMGTWHNCSWTLTSPCLCHERSWPKQETINCVNPAFSCAFGDRK